MRYFIYLIIFLSTSVQAGSIQKWVDEDGNIHYGDAPPVSVKTEQVRVIGAPSDPGKALPRLNNSGSGDSASSGEPGPSDVPEDQAKLACDRAQEDLKVLKSSSRIKLKAADGTSRYMTTEEIEERRKTSEEDVKNYCK